ncbi:Metallo-dependent hydrolase [Panus rudis PR-1116 ss-1]|nr:Metallo-dependent hydrolase [Panus rudis PR-1116 ss-1]
MTISNSSDFPLPAPASVLEHITDVHCHPTDSRVPEQAIKDLPIRICAMATRPSDQSLVRDLAKANPDRVTPCFGYHPWFSHWIALDPSKSKEEHYRSLFLDNSNTQNTDAFERLVALLPPPISLTAILSELRQNLTDFPNAMLGEVGLDRACRIPFVAPSDPPYVENESRRELSPFTIPLSHQLAVLEAQLELAVQLKRNVSVHSVKSQQATTELLDKMKAKYRKDWDAISIDMHSCGLSAQTWQNIEKKHANVYLSLSTVINSRSPSHKELIAACAPHRILVESDYNDIRYLTRQTWDMVRTIAEVKGWRIESEWTYTDEDVDVEKWGVVKRLEDNWLRFQSANHIPVKRRRDRRKMELDSDESDAEW